MYMYRYFNTEKAEMLGSIIKRWKQYKYRFVPWIALNIRKRKVRTVEAGENDKLIPDSQVEQLLFLFFTGLSRQDDSSGDLMCDPKVQRLKGQETERSLGYTDHSVDLPNQCKPGHLRCRHPDKIGCQTSGQTPSRNNFENRHSFVNLLEALNKRLHVHARKLYFGLKNVHFISFFRFQCKYLEFAQQVNSTLFCRTKLSTYLSSQQCSVNCATESRAANPTLKVECTISDAPAFGSYVCAAIENPRNDSRERHGTRLRLNKGLEVMESMLGFAVERRPSSIPGGGTGVLVTRGTVPAQTVVAMYPGTVYKSWEPILLQSVANPFIFRCLDGTLIDGHDKGISRMVYKSCAQRDRIGPYLTSDLSWLTDAPINPMAVGQYVNNQNKDHEANVAYQEFDVPDSFPFHLLHLVPNVFYSSAYQQGHSPLPRLMRTVVLVSLREINCGEELFSSYFTIVH